MVPSIKKMVKGWMDTGTMVWYGGTTTTPQNLPTPHKDLHPTVRPLFYHHTILQEISNAPLEWH